MDKVRGLPMDKVRAPGLRFGSLKHRFDQDRHECSCRANHSRLRGGDQLMPTMGFQLRH